MQSFEPQKFIAMARLIEGTNVFVINYYYTVQIMAFSEISTHEV